MRHLFDLALRFPRMTILVCLMATLAAAVGLPRLSVTYDTRIFFSEQNPYLHQLRAFERKFTQNNNVLFVVYADGADVTSLGVLKAVSELTDLAWQLPKSTKVESIVNFPHVVADVDSFSVIELFGEADSMSPMELQERRTAAIEDPLIVNRLINPDATATGVNVNFYIPPEASDEIASIVSAARRLAKDIEAKYDGLTVHVTGNVMLMAVMNEAPLRDAQLLVPVSLLVAGMMLCVFVRSVWFAVSILLVLVTASMSAMGVAGWAGHVVSPASIAAPIIILSLAMAAAVHVVVTVSQEEKSALDRRSALKRAFELTYAPITLTSITTAIGFAAMNFADAPPLRDLANIVIVGILLAYLYTFVLLPPLTLIAPSDLGAGPPRKSLIRVGRFVEKRSIPLLLLCPAAILLIGTGVSRIYLDDDFARYFDKRYEYRVASDFAEDHLTGLSIIEFDLATKADGGVYAPSYQEKLQEFAAWLKLQPGVISVMSIDMITSRIHRAMQAGDAHPVEEAFGSLDLVSQYFLLYEFSLPAGSDLTDQINVSRDSSRVTVILRGLKSGEIRELNDQTYLWLQANTPPEMHVRPISINVLFSYMSTINIRSMMVSTAMSICVISIILGYALRSFRYGLLSFVTNLMPAVIGFGIWGHVVGGIGLAGSVVTAMTLGIVVDDTIHFLMKYKHARESEERPPGDAIIHVFGTVGVAMLITTAALVTGFLLLLLSGFQVNRSLGALTAIIIAAALVIDWFLLPPLLRITESSAGNVFARSNSRRSNNRRESDA